VLRDVERRNGFSNRLLAQRLERHPELDPRDRGLVTTLVYGVLRHRARLDWQIDRVAERPKRLKGELREILRIGAYELRELDRPLRVVGDEANRLARRLDRKGGLTGVVTAVLAGIDARGADVDAEAEAAAPLDALERRWSIPRWLAGRWIKTLGAETALARARAIARPPTVDVRVDVSRTTRDEVAVALGERIDGITIEAPDDQPQCLRLSGAATVFRDPLHARGLISVQALGSQQAALALAPAPGERILDACAGMGTKTLHLAELMQREGEIVAADTQATRLAELEGLRERGGLDASALTLRVIEADLSDPGAELGPAFDGILLDAPCTGLGNLARHPELRGSSRYEDIATCAALQRRLLEALAPRLRPAGRLVYSVCSLEPEEGPELLRAVAPELGLDIVTEQSWSPESNRTDGFYLAVLTRPET
jgi:16S rRNA (cytosine967-C5)-methyltransferase